MNFCWYIYFLKSENIQMFSILIIKNMFIQTPFLNLIKYFCL